MKSMKRILMILPLVGGLTACLDANVPRLPTGTGEGSDTTKDESSGYIGQAQEPITIG